MKNTIFLFLVLGLIGCGKENQGVKNKTVKSLTFNQNREDLKECLEQAAYRAIYFTEATASELRIKNHEIEVLECWNNFNLNNGL
jgi:hypothetical protein